MAERRGLRELEDLFREHYELVYRTAGHFWRTSSGFRSGLGQGIGIATALEVEYPGRTFVVIPVRGRARLPPGVTLNVDPDYAKFDRALTTRVRPVLVNLHALSLRDFTAEEFVGDQELHCSRDAGCASVFKGSPITLGQIADAAVHVGVQGK